MWIQGRDLSVKLVINYANLLDDPYETEYLALTFEMMKYGKTFDMIPNNPGGDVGLYIDEEYITFWCDNENLYYNKEKRNE